MSVNSIGAGGGHDAAVKAAFDEGMSSVEADLQAANAISKQDTLLSSNSSSPVPLDEPVNPFEGAVKAVSKVVDVAKNILSPGAKAEPKVESETAPSDGPMAFADSSGGQGETNSSITKIPAQTTAPVDSRERAPRDTQRDARDTQRDARDTERAPRGGESAASVQPQEATQEPAPQAPTTGALAKPARSDQAIEAQRQAELEPSIQAPTTQAPATGALAKPARSDQAIDAQRQIAENPESQESPPSQGSVDVANGNARSEEVSRAPVNNQANANSPAQEEWDDEAEFNELLRTNPRHALAHTKSKTGDDINIPGIDGVTIWASDQGRDGVAAKRMVKLIEELYFGDPEFRALVDNVVAEKGSLDITVAKWDPVNKDEGAVGFSNGTEIVADSTVGVTKKAVTAVLIENSSNAGLSSNDFIAKIQVDNASNGR